MGVKGLQSFLKENRQSLCTSILLERDGAGTRGKIPVVVDAWGVIFQLYLDSLPWTSGGEYLEFYRLVKRLIVAWRDVGLEPTFVFDGASPPEKHLTALDRLQSHLSLSRLFFTTSPSSRSSPSFSRYSAILPPFASHTFIQALHSLDVSTHFVAQGEADGTCVTIAERIGGFVIGRDTDFLILVGAAKGCDRIQGYCPLDMMMWIEGEVKTPKPRSESFTTVHRRPPSYKVSSLLPPPSYRNPTLVLINIPPQALRHRLRLPGSLLPIFASLVGNDYTPASATEIFFEPGMNAVQKVEKVARILREQVFSRSQSTPSNVGDQAVELITKIVKKLAVKAFIPNHGFDELVDKIIEATFQYQLPFYGDCCSFYPFCGELTDSGCTTSSSTPLSDPSSPSRTCSSASSALGAYASAQRRGLIPSVTHGYLYPDRIYLWSVLEDPQSGSLKSGQGLTEVRKMAWSIAEQGLGGLLWPEANEDEVEALNQDKALRELLGVDGDKIDEDQAPESDGTVNHEVEENDSSPLDERIKTNPRKSRTITEYLRQGSSNRIMASNLELPPPSQSTPLCLAPLEDRLHAYLTPLHSDTNAIRTLPPHFQPLVAIIRFCVIEAGRRFVKTDSGKWKKREIEAVLKAGLGCWQMWEKERIHGTKLKKSSGGGAESDRYPLLTNRNSDIVAQISATMTDSCLLAQALLLLPDNFSGATVETPRETLTHMTPFIFFSGTILHILLSNAEPSPFSRWRWNDDLQDIFVTCLEALEDGLDKNLVIPASPSQKKVSTMTEAGLNGFAAALSVPPLSPLTEKEGVRGGSRSGGKRKKRGGKLVVSNGGFGKGRFDALGDLPG